MKDNPHLDPLDARDLTGEPTSCGGHLVKVPQGKKGKQLPQANQPPNEIHRITELLSAKIEFQHEEQDND